MTRNVTYISESPSMQFRLCGRSLEQIWPCRDVLVRPPRFDRWDAGVLASVGLGLLVSKLSRGGREGASVMAKRLYVGNLPFSATEESVREAFGAHGEVLNVAMIMDRDTGRPRGFGFVEMDDAGADAAIAAMNGATLGGRTLRVNEAQPRPEGNFRERRPRRESPEQQ